MKKKIWRNLELKTAAILLAVVAVLSISLYYIIYTQYYGLIISKLQNDAVIVHRYAGEIIEEKTFLDINVRDDAETELYINTQARLNEIRRISNLLYLYTAKKDDNGSYIYVIDGLIEDEISGDEYFSHIGDLIEPEILPYLERCLDGEVVLADDILITEWGIIYAAYFPVYDTDGNVIGAIGMEFDCANIYEAANNARLTSILIAVVVSIVFTVIAFVVVRKVVTNAEIAFTDVEKEKSEVQERISAIINASPMSSHFWGREGEIIDCNEAALELFEYKTKEDYINRWIFERSPEFQPGGQRSEVMGKALLQKAFEEEEGKFTTTWTHRMQDGTLMPAEVTFVRVQTGDNCFVAGYTRDLRKEKELEERAGDIHFDELTGAYTRKYLEDKMTRTIRILSRSAGEMSVMMVSIDSMKPYCEEYGAEAGDELIKTVVHELRRVARRADDIIARYSNEEFIVILPNTGKIGAQMIAGNLLREIAGLNIPHKQSPAAPYVTVSIGITTGKVFHRQRTGDYIRRVEEMLYISKQGGRNRFSYADL